jgi:hypothetical protein
MFHSPSEMAETAKINLAVQVKWNCVGPAAYPRRSAAHRAAKAPGCEADLTVEAGSEGS